MIQSRAPTRPQTPLTLESHLHLSSLTFLHCLILLTLSSIAVFLANVGSNIQAVDQAFRMLHENKPRDNYQHSHHHNDHLEGYVTVSEYLHMIRVMPDAIIVPRSDETLTSPSTTSPPPTDSSNNSLPPTPKQPTIVTDATLKALMSNLDERTLDALSVYYGMMEAWERSTGLAPPYSTPITSRTNVDDANNCEVKQSHEDITTYDCPHSHSSGLYRPLPPPSTLFPSIMKSLLSLIPFPPPPNVPIYVSSHPSFLPTSLASIISNVGNPFDLGVSILTTSVASKLAGETVGFYTRWFSNLDGAGYLTEGYYETRGGGIEGVFGLFEVEGEDGVKVFGVQDKVEGRGLERDGRRKPAAGMWTGIFGIPRDGKGGEVGGTFEGDKEGKGGNTIADAISKHVVNLAQWTLSFLPHYVHVLSYLLLLHLIPPLLHCNSLPLFLGSPMIWLAMGGKVVRFEVFIGLGGEEKGKETYVVASCVMAAVTAGWIKRKFFP